VLLSSPVLRSELGWLLEPACLCTCSSIHHPQQGELPGAFDSHSLSHSLVLPLYIIRASAITLLGLDNGPGKQKQLHKFGGHQLFDSCMSSHLQKNLYQKKGQSEMLGLGMQSFELAVTFRSSVKSF
jgi:hypothetical protein